jgi:dihydroorotate dehydrogenase
MYHFIRPLLFSLPPEMAHHFSLYGLKIAHRLQLTRIVFSKLPVSPRTVMGLQFPNSVGLGAGMDKNGEFIDSLASLGFGFIEIGTVTPRPQAGNPSPRLFRLPSAQALINRMGFNNQGVDTLVENVKQSTFTGILGINIGKNADTPLEKAVDDYDMCLKKVYPFADYVAINISSPNTVGLRQLQQGNELDSLLFQLKKTQKMLEKQQGKYVPLVVKIAPDLDEWQVSSIAKTLLNNEIEGVIATNTSLSRSGVESLKYADEKGGLSGKPLFDASTRILQQLHSLLNNKIAIIASGGIMTAEDARIKMQAGASLVQVYTGLVYHGQKLVKEISELSSIP